jgi:hypothetical protein
MVGSTAQLVALACHFNATCRCLPAAQFFPANSTCKSCEYIRFARPRRTFWRRAGRWALAAPSPDAWIAAGARPGRCALIQWQGSDAPNAPDRKLAGLVGGGGRWFLLTGDNRRTDAWAPSWQVHTRDAPDRHIWRVTYGLVSQNRAAPVVHRPLDAIRGDLTQTLPRLESFARRHGLDDFAGFFRKALECLSSDDPFALVYHKDLAPPGLLDLSAAQFLAASQAGWLFGGMGSWNDLSSDGQDQATYDTLSERLFLLLNEAICAATNSAAR